MEVGRTAGLIPLILQADNKSGETQETDVL